MKNFYILAISLSITACGGGGSSSDNDAPPPTPPVVASNLIGVWQHAQLDDVLSMDQNGYSLYQTAGDYCLIVSSGDSSSLDNLLGNYRLSDNNTKIDLDIDNAFDPFYYLAVDTVPASCNSPLH